MVLPLLIAAAAMGSLGKLAGGLSANSAARARGRALDMAAEQHLAESGAAADLGMAQDDAAMAHLATAQAAGGGGFGGSALDVLRGLSQQSLYKARSTIYRGQTQACDDRFDATLSRKQGASDLFGATMSAGSSFLAALGGQAESRRAAAGAG